MTTAATSLPLTAAPELFSFFIATPVAWPLRLRMLASGLLLLLAVQVLSHVVFVAVCARTLRTAPSSTVLEFLSVAHTTSAQLFPFALWGMLTWRSWIPPTDERSQAPTL